MLAERESRAVIMTPTVHHSSSLWNLTSLNLTTDFPSSLLEVGAASFKECGNLNTRCQEPFIFGMLGSEAA